jgi:RHS repeat-associated protein
MQCAIAEKIKKSIAFSGDSGQNATKTLNSGIATCLYYYGARYLDPRTSRWISTDPAMGEYIPQAPINDEAKKHNQNLPGMGGIFNTVNMHVYHYSFNSPIRYIDPDGRKGNGTEDSITFDAVIVGSGNVSTRGFDRVHIFTDGPILMPPDEAGEYIKKEEINMMGLSDESANVDNQTNITAITKETTSEDIALIKAVGGTIHYSKESSPGPGGSRPHVPNQFIYISPVLIITLNKETGEIVKIERKR